MRDDSGLLPGLLSSRSRSVYRPRIVPAEPVSEPAEQIRIHAEVNGVALTRDVASRRLLVDFLRDELLLTGTHVGCEHGICGACTIEVDGEPCRSCTLLAFQIDGSSVRTVAGLRSDPRFELLSEAFKRHHALQCGFCTPGFIATVLAADPADHADDEAIRELLSGNLCRCTGYQNIVAAVRHYWGRT